MKQQFLKSIAGTIRLTMYSVNRPLVPTAATVTIYTPSGATLQSETAGSVNSTTGEMTYALTTTHTAALGLNYKAVWKYTVSAVDYYETQLFDVVRSILSIPVTDDDLFAELESLRRSNYQATGTATSGTASTLVDTARRKEPDDHWKGGIVEILAGTGVNQSRAVSGYTQSSSTITVTPNWVTNPSTDSVYRVMKSYTDKIQQAFEQIEQMLYNKGHRHELILESSQIKNLLLYMTLEKICLDLTDEVDDKWDRLARVYSDKFDKEFNSIKLDYDTDESGFIDEQERQITLNSFRINRT